MRDKSLALCPFLPGLAIGALICLGVSCRDAEPQGTSRSHGILKGRDVVLVTIDTLRWDAVGFSGAGQVETPVLDSLAHDGAAFHDTHAHAVVTLPSHASILTGFHPWQHGVRDNAGFRLSPEVPTLAATLRSSGYATGAFVSAFVLARRFGLDRGFDVYDDRVPTPRNREFVIEERPGEKTVSLALAWWQTQAGRPRFLWVHLFAPHFPYAPPEPFASRSPGRPYFGEVALADFQLGTLLEGLRPTSKTPPLIIVTGDHGESLGEHGEDTHGLFAYESTLKVPLVIAGAGIKGDPKRPARHVDIAPTILDLLGIPLPAGLPGRSLFGPPPAAGEDVGSYFEALSAYFNRGWAPLLGRIEDGRKAIRLPLPELYDLGQDPIEKSNLAAVQPARLEAMLGRIPSNALERSDRDEVSAEERRRLGNLGYVSSPRALASNRFDPSLDPKNLIEQEQILIRSLTLYHEGRRDQAIQQLERLIAAQPKMTIAYIHLGTFYAAENRIPEAIEVLTRAERAGAGIEDSRRKLALLLMRAGKPEAAWATLAPDRESTDAQTQSALGRIAAGLGRTDEAGRRFSRALELSPGFPETLADQGILALAEGRAAEAGALLKQALDQDETLADGWNALGVLKARGGELEAALDAWNRAVDQDPFLADAWFNIAVASSHAGRPGRAVAALQRFIPLSAGVERARAEQMLGELRARSERAPGEENR